MLGAHFATRGLEPVPVDAPTGSTKQEKTRKHNRVPSKQKDEHKYDLGKKTPPQIQWTNRHQQRSKQRGHSCLHSVACCGWTTGTGHT